MYVKVHVDDPSVGFSVVDYSRGVLGSVVRFGEVTVKGRLAFNSGGPYAGWGVSNISQGLVAKRLGVCDGTC